MALIQCYECSKKIDEEAASCPNCGAPKRIEVQTWEYKCVDTQLDSEFYLEELGKEGWELVSSVLKIGAWNIGVGSSSIGDMTYRVYHYLKRPTGTIHV